MSYRFMRVLVMFDLPTVTPENRRDYRRFRKFLIRNGFVMMQESVYSRILLTTSAEQGVISMLKRNKPPAGIVQVMSVTEKQFAKMECITGQYSSEVLNTDERLVIL